MKIKAVIVLGAITAVTVGAIWFRAARAPAAPAPTPELLQLFGGREGFAVLQGAERIEAFRLNHPRGQEPTVTEGPVPVTRPIAPQLVSLLSAHDAYGWNSWPGCIPLWGVRLSFYRGADRIDVLLCFQCNLLSVSLNGTKIGDGNFRPMRPHLVRAIKALFPNDQALQELPENL
jgi:hypothetical protein